MTAAVYNALCIAGAAVAALTVTLNAYAPVINGWLR